MKVERKDYTMSNDELCMLASNLVVYMNRDAVEFLARSVTGLDITDFQNLGNAFEVFPPDEYYSAQVTAEVEAKDTARDNCTLKIQLISGYFEQQWGIGDYRYKQLNIKNFHNAADSKFLTTCRNVVSVAEEYLADLTPIGLTQLEIDALETEAQTMEDKMNAIITKKALRDSKTQERTQNGNELYAYCRQYSTIGKLIWENVDEAKYNDYIIYHKAPDLPGKVLNLAYDVPTNTLSWDAAPKADDYQAEYKSTTPGFEWAVCYEGSDLSCVHNPGSGSWNYRCRGHNDTG